MFPTVAKLVADDGVDLAVAARVLGFTRQAFYKWQACPVSVREREDELILERIRQIHGDDPEFGYRLIADELAAQGMKVSERRVWRICQNNGVFSAIIRSKRSGKGRPGPAVHDDMLQRHFRADSVNVAWVVDITEHHTAEGKVYRDAGRDVTKMFLVTVRPRKRCVIMLGIIANTCVLSKIYALGG